MTKITRNELLEAAEAVVVERGIANLTIDAVAAKAGMSKGGVLHHFPSKDKLTGALVTRSADTWRADFSEAYENAPPGPDRMARGLIEHCLTSPENWTAELRSITAAVFAALAQDPELLAPMRTVNGELREMMCRDGLPEEIGDTILAAMDGLWLKWILGISNIDQAQLDRVRCALEILLEHATDESLAKE